MVTCTRLHTDLQVMPVLSINVIQCHTTWKEVTNRFHLNGHTLGFLPDLKSELSCMCSVINIIMIAINTWSVAVKQIITHQAISSTELKFRTIHEAKLNACKRTLNQQPFMNRIITNSKCTKHCLLSSIWMIKEPPLLS